IIELLHHHLSLLSFPYNATAPPSIYPLSLHDALPISRRVMSRSARANSSSPGSLLPPLSARSSRARRMTASPSSSGLKLLACSRSEEHTSELQSRVDLVCRLLLEKKKETTIKNL